MKDMKLLGSIQRGATKIAKGLEEKSLGLLGLEKRNLHQLPLPGQPKPPLLTLVCERFGVCGASVLPSSPLSADLPCFVFTPTLLCRPPFLHLCSVAVCTQKPAADRKVLSLPLARFCCRSTEISKTNSETGALLQQTHIYR